MTTGSAQEQPITRDVLLDARLAQAKDTHRVEVRRIRIIPGHAAGLHVHNGPVVGSIVDGSAVYQDAGVTFLAYFLLGPGQEPELSFPAG